MSTGRSPSDPRDVDAEFARMLEDEGMVLRPGRAPQEPAAPEEPQRDDPWDLGPESPAEPPSDEDRARSRAAHPALGDPGARIRGAAGPRELDDEEVLYGDFEPPDPDLPAPTTGALWAWTALAGGFALMLAAALTVVVPTILGWAGGLCAIGGLVALLLRAPRSRDEDDDGAEV